VNNTTLLPPADGLIDPSGSHFINLTSLLTGRDNLRQGVADLLSLTATVPTLDIDGDAVADLDAKRIRFVGHSLGGIVGGVLLGLEPTITAATLAMPGGGIAKLLDGSATYGPGIAAGLAANGLNKGTLPYESFLGAAQTALDSGDPINYAAAAAAAHPIHMIEVVGGGGSLPDQSVPNSVAGAPLAGTEPLARLMALKSIGATAQDAAGIRGIVRFIAGSHSSILDPSPSPPVTAEMQSETAGFAATAGTTLTITNPDVVQRFK
jgi:pimeloyl-ACP methyl ester carboxylesterase